jgi:predicted MFS family arabinose efflux permease
MNGMLKTALSSTDYLLLTVGFFVCGIQVVFIATHLPTYLQDAGIGPEIASWALGLVGLFNIIGSLLAGWLGSFVSKAKLLAWLYLMRSVIIIGFLILPPSPMTALLFGAAMGLLWLGTIPLTSGLIVVFFGPAFLSMLYGVTFFSHQIGSFLGAWLGGWIYDNLGSYDLMWWIIIGSGVFAFIINLMIDERPKTLTTAAAE